MPDYAELLDRAADRLEKPGAWIQRDLARDHENYPVSPGSGIACSWCAEGAILAETTNSHTPVWENQEYMGMSNFLRSAIGSPEIYMWNDEFDRTQAEVVAAFRKAAQAAREA